MEDDKEVSAMAAVNAALAGLDTDAAARVLRWAADRYKVVLPGSSKSKASEKKDTDESDDSGDKERTRRTSISATSLTPQIQRQRRTASWLLRTGSKCSKGRVNWTSQSLNKELKNTGHGVSHMPHALDDLMKAKPRLLIQLKKKGTTKQARRKFKVTSEGIKRVKGMLKMTD